MGDWIMRKFLTAAAAVLAIGGAAVSTAADAHPFGPPGPHPSPHPIVYGHPGYGYGGYWGRPPAGISGWRPATEECSGLASVSRRRGAEIRGHDTYPTPQSCRANLGGQG